MERPLPYDSVDGVRDRLKEIAPHFGHLNQVQPSLWLNGEYVAANLLNADKRDSKPLKSPILNFFMTDVISRTSQTMAKCVKVRSH